MYFWTGTWAEMDGPNWPAPRFVSHSAPSGFNAGGRTLFLRAAGYWQALVGKNTPNSATPDDARCGTTFIVGRPQCGVLSVARGTILF